MIFVTVGTQFFDELIEEGDRLAGEDGFEQPVFAQIGLHPCAPRHIEHVAFVKDMQATLDRADLIITHAGTGSLCECIQLGKPFIAVVNDTKAGDHQREFVEHLSEIYDFCWVSSPKCLATALPHARAATPKGDPGLAQRVDDLRRVCNQPVAIS